MPAIKVKLTPLTPSGTSVFHPRPSLPVESKQDISYKTTSTATQTPDISTSLDWQFELPPNPFFYFPSTPDELNTAFPDFGSAFLEPPSGNFEETFPDFESGDYDALVEAFCAEKQFLALPPELATKRWDFTQTIDESPKSRFIRLPEVQENRIIDSGFDEFAGFGVDFDDLPRQSPSEDDGHSN